MMYPLVSADYQHLNASVNTARSRNPCSAVIPEPASFKQAQRQLGTSPRSLNREATAAVLMLCLGSYGKLSVSSERGDPCTGLIHLSAEWRRPADRHQTLGGKNRTCWNHGYAESLWYCIWLKKKKKSPYPRFLFIACLQLCNYN